MLKPGEYHLLRGLLDLARQEDFIKDSIDLSFSELSSLKYRIACHIPCRS